MGTYHVWGRFFYKIFYGSVQCYIENIGIGYGIIKNNIRFDLIDDGQINQFTLDVIEKDREWLEQEIQAQGYTIKDVYVAEYNGGKVVIYPYERKNALKRYNKEKGNL